MFRRPEALVLLSLFAGCAKEAPGGGQDATTSADTGGLPDAMEPPDAGQMDAEPVDSGVGNGCPPLGTLLDEGNNPPRRGDMAFAFDGTCNRIFMFYGDAAEPVNCNPAASIFLEDGYTFDVATGRWAAIEIAGGDMPLKRARSAGAWDKTRGRFLVFGGRYRVGTSGSYTFLNDLWALDPATKTWEQLSAQGAAGAPSGRMNTQIIADPDHDRILVFGGGRVAASGIAFEVTNDTWAFDLGAKTWSRLGQSGTPPEARLFHVTALDPSRQRLYVFSGGGADALTAAQFLHDMAVLDLATDTWSTVTLNGDVPRGRIKATLETDAARDRLVLFGGHDDGELGNENDVWTFDLVGQSWTRQVAGDAFNAPAIGVCDFPADFATIDPASPERRESHVFSIHGDIAVMHGGRSDCGLVTDTWVLDLIGMTWHQITSSFTGMTCHRSGRTDCDMPGAKKCG